MKYTALFLFIFSLISLTGCSESEQVTSDSGYWIDVRSAEEYATGHLEQAANIPHGEIATRIAEITSNKAATIHVYCRSGNRSGKAKIALEALGFTHVINEGAYKDLTPKQVNED